MTGKDPANNGYGDGAAVVRVPSTEMPGFTQAIATAPGWTAAATLPAAEAPAAARTRWPVGEENNKNRGPTGFCRFSGSSEVLPAARLLRSPYVLRLGAVGPRVSPGVSPSIGITYPGPALPANSPNQSINTLAGTPTSLCLRSPRPLSPSVSVSTSLRHIFPPPLCLSSTIIIGIMPLILNVRISQCRRGAFASTSTSEHLASPRLTH